MIIPVGMIASFPTRVLVDPTDSWALPALLLVVFNPVRSYKKLDYINSVVNN